MNASPDDRPAATRARSRWALLLALLAVGALVAAVHWPVLRAQARSFDDDDYVTDNVLVTHPGARSVARFFGEVLNPSSVRGYYLPVTMTSLMLDYAASRRPGDLFVFHRTNLLLHVANVLLVVLLLERLLGALWPAVIAGLLFGVHPLTVEPVAWVGERKTLLATFFALGSLLAYVTHARGGRPVWRVASVALYLLALLSKPTVAMLPVLLLILNWWPLRRTGRAMLAGTWPYFALSVASGVITFVSQQRTAGFLAVPHDDLPLPARACYLVAFYLVKILRPVDLSCAYPSPPPLSNPLVLLSIVLVAGLTAASAFLARRTRAPLAGWLFFLVAITPTLGVVRYTWVAAADKYVYFPALGLLAALAAGLATIERRPRTMFLAAVVPIVVVLAGAEARGVRTTLRNWTDSITLYRHMERLAPDAAVVEGQLGVLLEQASDHDAAMQHLQRALELFPDYPLVHHNLGAVLLRMGRVDEGLEHLRIADRLQPNRAPTLFLIGLALRMSHRPAEAAAAFRRALAANPDHVDARDELAGALVLLGRPAEAATEFRAAVALAPDNASLRHRLAVALLIAGGAQSEAAGQLREAIRLRPDWPAPFNALAWLLATSPDSAVRDTADAMRLAERAVALTGGRDGTLLDTFAAAQASAGRFAQAARTEREAIGIVERSTADSLARGMRERLKLYERDRAYREPAKDPAPS